MTMKSNVLYIVIPCYNEEEVLPISSEKIIEKLEGMIAAGLADPQSRILFVDDGSKDNTWPLIAQLHLSQELVCGLKLSRNRGHQNALVAGLMTAGEYADCVITVDADMQDDIQVMDEFLEKYQSGCDVVYGVRSSRKKDSFFKKVTAQGFYKFLRLMGADIVYNHADYRLLSKRVIDALENYSEVNLFLRGLIPLIGYESDVVYYERSERAAGESKYPLKKMIAFAVDGITSFSVKPLKIISNAGIIIAILSSLGLLYSLISKLLNSAVPGWTAIVASIWLLGGIQLFCLGIIGEYIGKIYSEVKRRPKYVIDKILKK